ncbi:MAG: NAD(P)-dependent oxidoreductase [Ornithinimicrobium sp.]
MPPSGTSPTAIGFVGVGHLGRLLAHNLIRAGFTVTVTDLDANRAVPLLAAGAQWADTPCAAARDSHCVITCLPSPAAVSACLEGGHGVLAGLAPGGTWIDMSTNDAREVQRIAELAASQGVETLECPVTGGVHTAEIGEITALVGGHEAIFTQHHVLLAAMANPVIYVGELGQASTLKVITNMLAFVNQWAAGEALMLARAAHVDLGRAYEGIKNSSGNSWSFEFETQLVLNGSYDFQFSLDLACKDLGLAYQLGRDYGVPLEIAGHVEQIFQRARAQYGGATWSTQVVKLLEESMGLDLRAEGFPASMFGNARDA